MADRDLAPTVVRRLTEFANGTLSHLYLDVAKDCLYVDSVASERRKAMVGVIDKVSGGLDGGEDAS
jgi:isoleucyl-tRNA synthetase